MPAPSLIVAGLKSELDMPVFATIAKRRGVLRIAGEDRVSFLQGLVTNDVARAAAGQPVYSALLTAQGRFLHDFFIVPQTDALLLDCEAERRADLMRRLGIYKLRAKVTIEDKTGSLAIVLLWGDALDPDALRGNDAAAIFADPRLPALGARAIVAADNAASWIAKYGFNAANEDSYDHHRIALGVPDGSRDLPVERALLLENGFDELHGIDWQKGCYIGQEVTARMRYRSLVRKQLLPVSIDGPTPDFGAPITLDGAEAGEMRSAVEGLGLALLRQEALDKVGPGRELLCAKATLRPLPPT
ncbi:MAG TPA: folate-binding protein [Verrucomicrobiae bacterium]|jgi:folate-binding protein YgfZ|nr:folate-binding protein [Verrucomicrobiae bacterium]